MKKFKQVVSLLLINFILSSSAFAQTKLTLGKQVFTALARMKPSITKCFGETGTKMEDVEG